MIKHALFLCVILYSGASMDQQKVLDYLIKNATVYDGTGAPGSVMHIGILKDRIQYIGTDSTVRAKQMIDATGYVLSPGFIDPHTHADRWLKSKDRNYLYPWIAQGVTTVLTGSDGFGTYNIQREFNRYEENGMGANAAAFVGFGPVRTKVMGRDYEPQPTKKQLEEMKKLVNQGMREGALGLSTGLLYVPQIWSETPEIVELSKVAAKYGGIYDTHMRSESGKIIESVQEVVTIGKEAGLSVHISHIKVSGPTNWGRSQEVIDLINQERAGGLDLTANQYPFVASMTGLRNSLVPKWAMAGGNNKMLERFENPKDLQRIQAFLAKRTDEQNKRVVVSTTLEDMKHLNGKTLYDLCQEWGLPIEEAAIKLLKMSPSISGMSFSMSEEDILNYSKQPWVMTGSDGGGYHPRTYSTFTQIIENFSIAKDLFPLE